MNTNHKKYDINVNVLYFSRAREVIRFFFCTRVILNNFEDDFVFVWNLNDREVHMFFFPIRLISCKSILERYLSNTVRSLFELLRKRRRYEISIWRFSHDLSVFKGSVLNDQSQWTFDVRISIWIFTSKNSSETFSFRRRRSTTYKKYFKIFCQLRLCLLIFLTSSDMLLFDGHVWYLELLADRTSYQTYFGRRNLWKDDDLSLSYLFFCSLQVCLYFNRWHDCRVSGVKRFCIFITRHFEHYEYVRQSRNLIA